MRNQNRRADWRRIAPFHARLVRRLFPYAAAPSILKEIFRDGCGQGIVTRGTFSLFQRTGRCIKLKCSPVSTAKPNIQDIFLLDLRDMRSNSSAVFPAGVLDG